MARDQPTEGEETPTPCLDRGEATANDGENDNVTTQDDGSGNENSNTNGDSNDDSNDKNNNNDDNNNDDAADGARSDEPECDEEGLRLEYDVVLYGTGLVQSILASALSRAGKSVLHCDGADHYGGLDAVWTLPEVEALIRGEGSGGTGVDGVSGSERGTGESPEGLLSLVPGGPGSLSWDRSHCSSTSGKRFHGIRTGTRVATPFGEGTVRAIRWRRDDETSDGNETNTKTKTTNTAAVEIEMGNWKLANDQSPVVYVNAVLPERAESTEAADPNRDCVDPFLLEDVLSRTRDIRSVQSVEAEAILRDAPRTLALDASPAFVLASGRAVEGMLQSGVADYLEFKTVNGLYWLEHAAAKDAGKRRNRTKTTDTNKDKDDKKTAVGDEPMVLSRVPCSKNDIFATKLLAPMEKRRFMKFIQLCMDYATKMTVAEVLEQNDDDDNEEEVQSLNERHLNQGRSLARPQNKAVDATELQTLREAIDNESVSFDDFLAKHHKLSPKLRSIVRYALAWETTASSTSLEGGMGALRKHLQALGRYGTTAFLVPLYGTGELSQAFCRSAAVFGATYLLRRDVLAVRVETAADETASEPAKHVEGIVLSTDQCLADGNDTGEDPQHQPQNPRTKTVKCSQVVVPINAMDRGFFRQNGGETTTDRPQKRIARRISVLKGSVVPSEDGEQRHVVFVPPDTVGNDHVIHGVVLDSSAHVAPRGYTLLHLTTTVEDGTADTGSAAAVLERAQAAVLRSKPPTATGAGSPGEPPVEVYHVSFNHPCRDPETAGRDRLPSGLHLCSHSGQALTADAAFEQAEAIFSSICPGARFLGLSSSIDEVIRERAEEKYYDDEEKTALESAVGMIGDASADANGSTAGTP